MMGHMCHIGSEWVNRDIPYFGILASFKTFKESFNTKITLHFGHQVSSKSYCEANLKKKNGNISILVVHLQLVASNALIKIDNPYRVPLLIHIPFWVEFLIDSHWINCFVFSKEKVYEEVSTVFFGDKNKPAEVSDLAQLKFLEQCIKESLRKLSTVPIAERYVTHDVTLSGIRFFQRIHSSDAQNSQKCTLKNKTYSKYECLIFQMDELYLLEPI